MSLATNAPVIVASLFLGGQIAWVYQPPSDPVTIGSPLAGSWYVVHGGRSELVNDHNIAVAQDYALDILRVVDGSSQRGSGRDVADYYAWHEPVRAPADGVVSTVVDQYPDQPIGSVDRAHPAGNHLVLKTAAGAYVCFGHLSSHSIAVAVGDSVRAGDLIGLVGNSGNSDEPHLHLQAQNNPVFDVLQPPRGLRTYPLLIEHVSVQRNGREFTPAPADLRRGDIFQPVG